MCGTAAPWASIRLESTLSSSNKSSNFLLLWEWFSVRVWVVPMSVQACRLCSLACPGGPCQKAFGSSLRPPLPWSLATARTPVSRILLLGERPLVSEWTRTVLLCLPACTRLPSPSLARPGGWRLSQCEASGWSARIDGSAKGRCLEQEAYHAETCFCSWEVVLGKPCASHRMTMIMPASVQLGASWPLLQPQSIHVALNNDDPIYTAAAAPVALAAWAKA